MKTTTPGVTPSQRVEREVERERRERLQHDDQRTGLAAEDEFRLKDARENAGAANIRRSGGR
jgi:hypothetical protein